MTAPAPPELSRPVDPRRLDARPVTITASAEEAQALARRFGLVAVQRLVAEMALSPVKGGTKAEGRLMADIVQSCAVSGDDLPVAIEEEIALRFVPARDDYEAEEEIELTREDLDDVEYSGDRFDLGEAVAQTLALAIDPFATGPDADAVRGEAGLSDAAASGPLAEMLKGLTGD